MLYGITFILFIILVVGPLLASLYLTRVWALEEAGTDLDEESLKADDVRQIPPDKRLVISLLWVPPLAFLVIFALYVLASVALFN